MMKRSRSIRFAPEALERKLSPSTMFASPFYIAAPNNNPGLNVNYGTSRLNPNGSSGINIVAISSVHGSPAQFSFDEPLDPPPPPPIPPVN